MEQGFDLKRKRTGWLRFALLLLCTAAMLLLVIRFSAGISSDMDARSLGRVRAAVQSYVVQFYALEGRYPQSLEELQSYGLTLDTSRYVYHYENLGDNLLPELAVFLRKD